MPGIGLFPVGLGPCGFGTPISADPIPAGPVGCRFIDPSTGDYAIDIATRQFQQMPPLRQRVLLALTTLFRSNNAVPGFGIKLPQKLGSNYQVEVTNAVNAAVYQLTSIEKIMQIDSIVAQKGSGGRSLITVSYTDLTTKQKDSVSNGK